MTSAETAAQCDVQQIVQELEAIRTRLEGIHARLPVPPEEFAMLRGETELDFATEMRSIIECVLTDNLGPAIRDLAVAASSRPGGGKE